ncbi:hypothetical protein LOD99_13121 [Oopsacas minuta]|uniref:Uncharacterized protein n=1 Tax=Oopsacas minuta TaxID=111878 RepID=A0AAV7JAY0_9METZ|nr:hypothetical protein LOD99_13121 [Oopsacas minuta]
MELECKCKESKKVLTDESSKKMKWRKRVYLNLKSLFRNKYLLITLSTLGIVFIWILVFIPLIVRVVEIKTANRASKGGGVSNQRSSNLTNRLPPLNITFSIDTMNTTQRILCINNFIFSPNDSYCFPSCTWDPFDGEIATFKQVLFALISIAGLILGIGTLIGWVATSCIDWKKKRIMFNFQLARTSLFMVVICSILLLVINVTVDLLDRGYLFCSSGDGGEQYLPAHLNQYTSTDSSVKVVINLIGALYHYLSLCSLCWLAISFLNIFLIVFFPLKDRQKRSISVFLIECLVAFSAPLFPIILATALDSDSPYGVVYTLQQIYVFDAWLNTILHTWLYYLISGVIITLAIIIVLKLRINSINSMRMIGKCIKLTGLEKRLLAYSLVLMFVLFIIGSQLLLVNSIADSYHFLIEEYILCTTVNSPIELAFFGTNITQIVYRVNTIGDVQVCKSLLDDANSMYPSWCYMLLSILFRVFWFIPFIILIPCCSCKCFKKAPIKASTNAIHLIQKPSTLKFKAQSQSQSLENIVNSRQGNTSARNTPSPRPVQAQTHM